MTIAPEPSGKLPTPSPSIGGGTGEGGKRVHDSADDQALRASEARYRVLFDSMDEGFCIVEKLDTEVGEPPNFRYIEANPALAVHTGVSGVVGKTFRQAFPDESDDWLICCDSVLETGEPVSFERALGERVLELRVFRIEDGSGRRVAVNVKDITARKRAELAQRRRTEQFEAFLTEVPLGIYVVDADFRVIEVNPLAQRSFEHLPVPLVGRDFSELAHLVWPNAIAVECISRFRHTLETGQSHVVPEMSARRRDLVGTECYEWQVNRIPLPDGRNGVVCFFRDISERFQAQDKIREGEERYLNLFNSMDEGYCIIEMIFDADQKAVDFFYLEVNPSFAKQAGFQIETGRRVRGNYPEIETHWFEFLGNVVLTGEPIRAQVPQRANSMGGSFFDLYAFQVGGRDSRKLAVLFTDITQRKETEKALRESDERYRNLFNSIDEAFCIIEMIFDEHGKPADYRYLEVNPTFEKQTGLCAVTGRRVLEVVPGLEAYWFEFFGKIALTGESNRMVNEAKSMAGRWFDLYAVSVGDRQDRKVAVVFNDVTARRKSEEALRRSEERFRALFDRGPMAMYFCDASGAVQEFNARAAELWRWDPQRKANNEPNFGPLKVYLADGTLMPRAENPIATMLAGKPPAAPDAEFIIQRLDRSRIPVIANFAPLRDGWGEISGVIGCFYDISERKQAELMLRKAIDAAEKADRAKSEFLSSMSHELRTPLNAILGFAQLMESGIPAPTATQQRNLEQILKGGWYLLTLINEILDLALIEAGKVTLVTEPTLLADVMLDCRTMIDPQAQQRGIRLIFPRFEKPWVVETDPIRLKQILINLLSNAIKYNAPGGTVTVECSQRPPHALRISVRDTGAGLAPAQLAQLFQPFNRLGQEASAQEGTGIGLVVAKRLIELMGGTIGVDSAVGVGTVFWIELRLAAAPPLALAKIETAGPARALTGAPVRTVLHVEDNPANLELVEQLLARRTDLRLMNVANANLGIEFARAYQPAVILMDINLVGISGIAALKILRADSSTAHIPIIAVSANAMPGDIVQGLKAGFFNYLTKPIKFDTFLAALDEALAFSLTVAAAANQPGVDINLKELGP